jgi:rhamnulokinase
MSPAGAHHFIAIDLGAESGRVMLGTLDGGKLTLEEVHRFPNGAIRVLGTLRWDLPRIFHEIKAGLRMIATRGLKIESVSVDSWGLDFALIRGREPLLRLPYVYRDARTEGPYVEARATAEAEIFEHTGIQFMPINTLYQLLADAREDAALLAMADRMLLVADWLHYLLCGRAVAEETNASTTQLYDPRKRAWSDALIEKFDLPRRIFPEIVKAGTVLDVLLPEMREETGLGAVPVIAGCTHDTAAAVAAVPASGEDWAYLSSGTWSLIGVELPQPLIDDAVREANFTNEAGYGGTTRFLKNIAGMWLVQECRAAWAREGREMDYATITALAAEAPPLRSLIDPNDPRFLRPADMPAEIRGFCRATGQAEPATPGEFARCIFESLALCYGTTLDEIERLTGRAIRVLHIVGGGSKNALLNQFAADASGRTVIAGPGEATAVGNVLVQALAARRIPSLAAARGVVRESFEAVTFTPREASAWDGARDFFSNWSGGGGSLDS